MYSYCMFSMATLTEVFPCFFSAVRPMPGYNPQRRGTARTIPNFCVVLCIVCFVSFCVFFVCICVLYYCHRLATQIAVNKCIISYISHHISYHIISYHIVSYHIISYHIILKQRSVNFMQTQIEIE